MPLNFSSPPVVRFAVLASVCLLLSGCQPAMQGSGTVTTESRDVSDFERVNIMGSANVRVQPGDEFSVKVTTDDNIQPLILTETQNDTLSVGSTGSYSTWKGVSVDIVMPLLSGVTIAGSGDLEFSGMDADAFDVTISGSGSIRGSGSAKNVVIKVFGSGEVELGDFRSEMATATVSGSGDVDVNASVSLDASVLGSGDISYRKHPDLKVTQNVTGSGDVSAR